MNTDELVRLVKELQDADLEYRQIVWGDSAKSRTRKRHRAALDALLAYDLSAPASPAPEHRCGVHGFDQMRGDVCPACSARHASPAPMPTVEVGDVVLLESGGVEYVRTKHAEDYWTGADAEGFPDVAERRKARILAIYRDPLWRRPAPMPTTGDES